MNDNNSRKTTLTEELSSRKLW